MKAERSNDLLGDPVWDEELIRKATLGFFEQILGYIAATGDLDKPAFLNRLDCVKDERIQRTVMTLAQQFRQEGREEGRQEGRLTGERILLERLLSRKFGPLPEWTSAKLEKATLADLEVWGETILDAVSLDAVFQQR